jgi:hypothetical protein
VIPAPTTGRALHSEWIKIRTLRSTWLTALLTTAASLAIAALAYRSAAHNWPRWTPSEHTSFDPVHYGFSGPIDLAVLTLGTLGVLTASAEYGTGAIRTTFTATPRRAHVVTAKILTVGGFALALGETTALAVFTLGQHLIAGTGAQVTLTHPHVARAVLGTGAFLAATTLIGLGLGFWIRRTAGALAALFGLYFLAPLLLGSIGDTPAKAALHTVFTRIASMNPPPPGKVEPSVPAAFTILAAYVVLSLGAAYTAVRRRDA